MHVFMSMLIATLKFETNQNVLSSSFRAPLNWKWWLSCHGGGDGGGDGDLVVMVVELELSW